LMGDSLLPGALRRLSFSDRSKRRLDRELYYFSAVLRADRSRWKELWNQRLGGFREMREVRIWNRYHRSTNKKARSVQELYQALVLANLSYVPTPYDGRVLYLQSGDRPQSDLWNLAASWEGFIEKLEVYEAPGDHTSLFKEPNVRFTAARIQRELEDVPTEPSMQHALVSSWSRSVSVAGGTLGSLP
jgi:thioesterase domain-containing protein